MRGDQRRVLRVFHEYDAEWPLWEDGTDGYETSPADYGLSVGLTERLRECGRLFEGCFRHDTGWTSPSARQEYAEGMRQAVATLRREVPRGVLVQDEHTWCLRHCDEGG